MRVLIVGGTGNISTPLTQMLHSEGADVTVFNRGHRLKRIPRKVKVVLGDRTKYASFERQMKALGTFDCVIDMIGFHPAEVRSAIRAFRGRTRQYIFCSTTDVYTKDGTPYPILEEHEKKPVRDFPYAYDKAACERLLFAAHRDGAFELTVLRPAQTYSEGGSPLVHPFRGGTYHLDRIRAGKPIILHGDGSSLWSACHSIDVARAFKNAAGNPTAFGKAYHLTGEEWMTHNRLWSVAAEVMRAPKPRFVHIPTDLLVAAAPELASWCGVNFQFNNVFDNSAARRDLGFEYTIPWRTGVLRCWKWLQKQGGMEDSDAYGFYDAFVTSWERCARDFAASLKGVHGVQ